MKKSILLILLFVLASSRAVTADWAYGFVVYSGNTYMVDKTEIGFTKIDRKIGQVTFYSDREGTYSGNFSNVCPKGTPYFSIKGVSPDQEIAVKEADNLYVKAVFK